MRDEQIKAASKSLLKYSRCSPEYSAGEDVLEAFGFEICEKCCGTGHLSEENEDGSLKYATGGSPIIINCPRCDELGAVTKGDW